MPEGLYALALLACPLGMGAMMWIMMRGNHTTEPADPHGAEKRAELAALQAQVDQLQAAQRDRDPSGATGQRPQ